MAVHALKGEKTRLHFNINSHDTESKLPVKCEGVFKEKQLPSSLTVIVIMYK